MELYKIIYAEKKEIKKYDVDKIDMYKFSKNGELPFLLLCIISNIKNENKEIINRI